MNYASLTLSREEAGHMRHMEQLRMENKNFFKVYFNGDIKRVHCLKDIKIQESTGPDGKTKYTAVEGDRCVEAMEINEATGRSEAYVFEDPEDYNIFWLSRNAEALDIEIEDDHIRRKVESYKTKPYKMPDSRREILAVEKRKIERELKLLDEEDKKIEEQEKKIKNGKLKTAEMTTDKIRQEPKKPVNKPVQPFVKGLD